MIVDAVRGLPKPIDIDVVIGVKGPISPPSLCNDLTLQIVTFDQIYASNIDEFIESVNSGGQEKSRTSKPRRSERVLGESEQEVGNVCRCATKDYADS